MNQRPKRDTVIMKLIMMGILILVLFLPLEMEQSIVQERQKRHDDVVRSVADTWGGAQTLGGPVLTVPYTEVVVDEKGNPKTVLSQAW